MNGGGGEAAIVVNRLEKYHTYPDIIPGVS